MALCDIVKNIYTFANILSQAGTDAVKKWNEKSLNNALNWAAYCTKISEHTRNSSYRNDLDVQVQSFTIFLKPPSLVFLTLDSLSRSEEILCKRLLQNPHCPAEIIQVVHDLQVKNIIPYVQDTHGQFSEKCDKHLFLLLGEEPEFDQSASSTIASYILDRLLHLINLPPVSETRFNRFLEQIVPMISDSTRGMESLAKLLLTDVKYIVRHSDTEKIKNQIAGIILQDSNELSNVWRLDSEILCELSSRDDLFLEHHVQFILSWIESMEPVYGITQDGALYTWRCSRNSDNNNNFQTYEKLKTHLRLFTNYSRRMKCRLMPHLENLANKTYFNISRDLLTHFHTTKL